MCGRGCGLARQHYYGKSAAPKTQGKPALQVGKANFFCMGYLMSRASLYARCSTTQHRSGTNSRHCA